MSKTITVTEYIAEAPEWAQGTLRDLRKVIKTAAPNATESISYHMPYYAEEGRLAYFGVYKNHCSFHWISTEDKKIFARDLAKQKVVGSTLQIPKGTKVPVMLIKKIVKSRVAHNKTRKQKGSQHFPKTSAPAERALAHAGIRSLKQLSKYSESQVAGLHGMGPKAIGILKKALKAEKLSFKQ